MKKTVLALFIGSFVIRIIYVEFFNVNPVALGQDIYSVQKSDQDTYWQLAEAFLRDTSWMSTDVSIRPPVYPLFLAFIAYVAGSGKNFINIMLAQAFISAVCVIIIYCLAESVFNKRTALFAALWAAVNPQYLYYSGYLLRETMIVLLFLLLAFCLIKFLKDRNRLLNIIVGLLYAILIHADPRFLFHLPFIFIYFYLVLRSGRKTLRAYSLFVLTVIIFSLPWGIRNHIVYNDRFVLINTETNKWIVKPGKVFGMHAKNDKAIQEIEKPKTLEDFEVLKRKAIIAYQKKHRTAGFHDDSFLIEDKPYESTMKSEEGRNASVRSVIHSYDILHRYLFAIESEEELNTFVRGIRPAYDIPDIYWNRFKEFWRFARFEPDYAPYPDLRFYPVWSWRHNIAGIVSSGVLYPFFVVGAFFCVIFYFRHKNKYGLILFVIILVHTLLHVFVHSTARYRVSIEAFVAIIAFFSIVELISRYEHMKENKIESLPHRSVSQ